jgi:hypothetical protein
MSSKPGSRSDVMRRVNQECLHSLSNLLRRETLREQMERNQERSLGTPIGQMKSNPVGVENLVGARVLCG